MDWNEMFVALSRASTAENIGMEIKSDKVYQRATPPPTGEMIKVAPHLFEGFVYDRTDGPNHYFGSTTNFQKRKAEHEDKAVSRKVEEWEREVKNNGKEIKMSVVEKFICSSEKQLVRREYYHIARVPAEFCMNTNGVCKVAVEQAKTVVAEVAVDHSRYKIVDDTKRDRFRIQWREDGKPMGKDFPYKRKGKEEQLKAAEAFRALLVKKFLV
jgi:hypothetical protein